MLGLGRFMALSAHHRTVTFLKSCLHTRTCSMCPTATTRPKSRTYGPLALSLLHTWLVVLVLVIRSMVGRLDSLGKTNHWPFI